ncbi:hypothetical protein ACHIPZ_11405 [Antrihabitans sp. NCIMB 15449]|uniref:Uncharacterized protein n=1 Tax=Antrihabitans spumae TaxID=3373370 RepID=A0ABW7JQG2_9NOCA
MLEHKSAVLAEHSATVRTDPDQIERSVAWPGVDKAQAFVDAGVSLFTVGTSGPKYKLVGVGPVSTGVPSPLQLRAASGDCF